MKKVFLFILVLSFLFLADKITAQETKVNVLSYPQIWVEMDPVRGANPWESYWLKKNKKRRITQFPRGNSLNIEPEEAEIIKEYYQTRGLKVTDVRSWSYEQRFGEQRITCKEDNCPAGYTLFLFIANKDLKKAQQLGFKLFDPFATQN